MKRKTGRSIRELEAEWDRAEREINQDRLFDPDKYQNLNVKDGTLAQVIGAQFEKNVIEPEVVASDNVDSDMSELAEADFEDELQNEFENDTESIDAAPSDDISIDDESLDEDLDQIEGELDEVLGDTEIDTENDQNENVDEIITDTEEDIEINHKEA